MADGTLSRRFMHGDQSLRVSVYKCADGTFRYFEERLVEPDEEPARWVEDQGSGSFIAKPRR